MKYFLLLSAITVAISGDPAPTNATLVAPNSTLVAPNSTLVAPNSTLIAQNSTHHKVARSAMPGDVINSGDVDRQKIYSIDRPIYTNNPNAAQVTGGGNSTANSTQGNATHVDGGGGGGSGDKNTTAGNNTGGATGNGSNTLPIAKKESETVQRILSGLNGTAMEGGILNTGAVDKQLILNIENKLFPQFTVHFDPMMGGFATVRPSEHRKKPKSDVCSTTELYDDSYDDVTTKPDRHKRPVTRTTEHTTTTTTKKHRKTKKPKKHHKVTRTPESSKVISKQESKTRNKPKASSLDICFQACQSIYRNC